MQNNYQLVNKFQQKFFIKFKNLYRYTETYLSLSKKHHNLIILLFIVFNVIFTVFYIYKNTIFKYTQQNIYLYINFNIKEDVNFNDVFNNQVTLSPMDYHKVIKEKFVINNLIDLVKLIPGNIDYSYPKLYITSYLANLNICWYIASVNDLLLSNDLNIEIIKNRISNIKLIKLKKNNDYFELDLDYAKHQYILPNDYGLQNFTYDFNKKIWLIFPINCDNDQNEEYLLKNIYNFLIFDWQKIKSETQNEIETINIKYRTD